MKDKNPEVINIGEVEYMRKDLTTITPLGENELKWNGEVFVRKGPVSAYDYEAGLKAYEEYCNEKNVKFKPLPYPNPEDDDEKNTNAYQMVKNIVKNENNGKKADAFDENQWKYYPWFKKNPSGSGLSCDGYGGWSAGSDVPACLCSLDSDKAVETGKKYISIYNILQT